MEPMVDAARRPTIVLTPAGLTSMRGAVKKVGHELLHIRDFQAGVAAAREIEAEQYGVAFWPKLLSRAGE